jgi:hypothetical protein
LADGKLAKSVCRSKAAHTTIPGDDHSRTPAPRGALLKGIAGKDLNHTTKHKVLDKRSQNPYTNLVTRVSKIAYETSEKNH